jgi:hypothetical protein
MYDEPEKPDEEYHPDHRPVKPEITASQLKAEIAGREDLSAREKAERFADDMPLDTRLYE